jgi:dTDP-4-amino-4,6-dideoxygalactose transaminase
MLARVRSNLNLEDLWLGVWDRRTKPRQALEDAFTKRFGFQYAFLFPSARGALRALLQSLALRDAEVLVPAYLCAEVPYAVTASGNRVKFVDSAPGHFLPTSAQWHSAATPKTRMAIITPLFGYPVDPDCQSAISRVAPGAFILFDEAQSYGAMDSSGLQMRNADGALFSLGLGKMAVGLSGGMLLLRDAGLRDAVDHCRTTQFARPTARHALQLAAKAVAAWAAFREPALTGLDFLERKLGITAAEASDRPPRFDEAGVAKPAPLPSALQARIGLRQLDRLDSFLAARRRIGRYYEDRLRAEGFGTFRCVATPNWTRYPFAVVNRQPVIAAFRDAGVQISRYLAYSCAELPLYREGRQNLPNASRWARRMLSLPNWYGIELSQADRVLQALFRLRSRNPEYLLDAEPVHE